LLLPASLAGPCRPDPPRCCVDLQRLTAIPSRLSWFPGSACALCPFGLDPGVFAMAAPGDCSPGLFAAHGLALTLEDRSLDIVRASWPAHDRRPFDPSCSRGVHRPSGAPSPGDPCPGDTVRAPNNSVACSVSPRRGFPGPRRPPASFLTTLTVCSPPDPVVCFNHSRPWGSGSLPLAETRSGGLVSCRLPAGAAPGHTEVWSVPAPPLPVPEGADSGFRLPSASCRSVRPVGRRSSRPCGDVAMLPLVSCRRLRRPAPFRPSGSPHRRSELARADPVHWSCPCCWLPTIRLWFPAAAGRSHRERVIADPLRLPVAPSLDGSSGDVFRLCPALPWSRLPRRPAEAVCRFVRNPAGAGLPAPRTRCNL
jgi:hypothetical protein